MIQNSSADLTISATIANNTTKTALTKSGSGRLILSGANTYSGANWLNAGILSISDNSNLGFPTTNAAINFAGGMLQATATFALDDGGVNKRAVNMGETTTSGFDVTGGNVLTVSGNISGIAPLNKTGTGTLKLTGTNTYFDDTILSGGIVNLGAPERATPAGALSGPTGPLGSGTSTVYPGYRAFIWFRGGTLQYSAVNNYDYSCRFSTADNQAYSVDLAGQTVTWATNLTSVGGSLTLTDSVGGGTLTLSGINTYTGGTTVSSGTLEVSGSISSSVSVANGAVLKLDNSTALAVTDTLALAASPSAGTVNLNFSGTQTIRDLLFGATAQATGTWGAIGSSATHQNAAFTGSGILNVVPCSQTNAIVSIVENLDSTFTLTFQGSPQSQYYVVASPTVTAAMSSWLPVAGSTNTAANPSGQWQVTVTNTAAQKFYRSVAMLPCP